jgi:hypothetical protein
MMVITRREIHIGYPPAARYVLYTLNLTSPISVFIRQKISPEKCQPTSVLLCGQFTRRLDFFLNRLTSEEGLRSHQRFLPFPFHYGLVCNGVQNPLGLKLRDRSLNSDAAVFHP